jgi:hypothetical protein
MERDVIDIVKEKEFIELSAAERAELGELCSTEEEFNQMKAMFSSIGAMNWSNPTPRAETKESLDHLFAQKHPKAAPIWYNAPLAVIAPKDKPIYRQPLVQAAAVGLLILLAYPFVKSNMMTSETTQVAVLEKENLAPEVEEAKAPVNEEVEVPAEVEARNEVETPVEVESDDVLTIEYKEVEMAETRDMVSSPASVTSAGASVTFANAAPSKTVELSVSSEPITFGDVAEGGAIAPGSDHPDGIFIGDKPEIFSVPASREPAVFDLLTATF